MQVNGLTIAGRESYLSLLTDALRNNLQSLKGIDEPDNELSRRDVEQCAVELEYEAFSSSTVISLYRRAMTKLVNYHMKFYNLTFRPIMKHHFQLAELNAAVCM